MPASSSPDDVRIQGLNFSSMNLYRSNDTSQGKKFSKSVGEKTLEIEGTVKDSRVLKSFDKTELELKVISVQKIVIEI